MARCRVFPNCRRACARKSRSSAPCAPSHWQIRVSQTGPAIVQWMPHVAAPCIVHAGVKHGAKGVWQLGLTTLMQGVMQVWQVTFVGHGPIRVQKGAQVGLTEAQGWQVATCVWQG